MADHQFDPRGAWFRSGGRCHFSAAKHGGRIRRVPCPPPGWNVVRAPSPLRRSPESREVWVRINDFAGESGAGITLKIMASVGSSMVSGLKRLRISASKVTLSTIESHQPSDGRDIARTSRTISSRLESTRRYSLVIFGVQVVCRRVADCRLLRHAQRAIKLRGRSANRQEIGVSRVFS